MFTTAEAVRLDPDRPLAVIDVDEVLALFVQGFRAYLAPRGVELRMTSFALFGNMYAAEAEAALERAEAKGLLDAFFAEGCGGIEPAPGAAEGLAALSRTAQVVILTNAPSSARAHRGAWLQRHGMDYPLILNEGAKGPAMAAMAARVGGPALFVDDLLPNLESVAEAAPHVARYQMVADPLLRAMAPAAPERHARVDDWPELVRRAEAEVFGATGWEPKRAARVSPPE